MAKTCNSCGTENQNIVVPYAAHEIAIATSERHSKRLWIVILVLIGSLIASNLAWIIYESQFETVETITEEYDIEQDAEGGNNNSIINGGSIVNGEAEDKVQENKNKNP